MSRDLWDDARTETAKLTDELVYRSNLLGRDRTVCNFGGGNTSFKTIETDFRGRQIKTIWVKGSGSDLASATVKNFTALDLENVKPLFERVSMTDEAMVEYLTHCMTNPSHPRMSIETLLHAFLPMTHVDHTHPDSIISICTSTRGRDVAREIWGNRFVWVPYVRPGFELSKMIAEEVAGNPLAELVLMEKHGLVTWGETSKECYHKTLAVIGQAEEYLSAAVRQKGQALFGGMKSSFLAPDQRKIVAAKIMPLLRNSCERPGARGMILNFDDSDEILRFVSSVDTEVLSQVGAACPDHLVHTKRTPLYINWDPNVGDKVLLEKLVIEGLSRYVEDYQAYFNKHHSTNDIMSAPAPRVVLIPGVGMITTGKTKNASEISASLYHRAIAVMAGATALGEFVSLNAAESFAIEYWPLELYKLGLAPPDAEFSRKVVFITGAGGGIGGATARLMAKAGAHVVVTDIRIKTASETAEQINSEYGEGRAVALELDVTNEAAVRDGFVEAVLAFGGVDILVNNAGLASSAPLSETTLDDWNRNLNVLGTGYFLIAREAFRLMVKQKLGGAMVFVCSKNSVFAGKNASAYSAAKAAELHLARCIAAEGGDYGIRVNTVLPDAVLQGSAIWNSTWRTERAASYGIEPSDLEEHYRKRTVLGVNITSTDVAESIVFLASTKAAKTTGCSITVDGGVAAAFMR